MPDILKVLSKQVSSVVPMPLFNQIKDAIRHKIMDGSYSVHAKLPSERELTEIFQVSRVTVRQALAELQREGLVFKINGKGTFVSKPRAALDGSKLRGFGEAMSNLGYESFARVLSIKTIAANEDLASQLSMPSNGAATEIQRLRFLNREPISLDVTYFRQSTGQIIAAADLENRDIISLLENECGMNLGKAKVKIGAQLCDEHMKRHLNIEEGGPVLHIERTLFDTNSQPVLYENLYYRGDAFRYSLDIDR